MSRGVNDATRSIAKHVAVILGDAWEVRIPGDESFDRPFAQVARVGARAVTEQGYRFAENIQPFIVRCFPPSNPSAEQAGVAAGVVEDRLYEGFWQGVDYGHPARIPFYDYDGIPLGRIANRRDPRDYLRVVDFSTQTVADAADPRLLTVIADLRVAWITRAALPSEQRTVKRVLIEENLG